MTFGRKAMSCDAMPDWIICKSWPKINMTKKTATPESPHLFLLPPLTDRAPHAHVRDALRMWSHLTQRKQHARHICRGMNKEYAASKYAASADGCASKSILSSRTEVI